jgi:hypothetical protein
MVVTSSDIDGTNLPPDQRPPSGRFSRSAPRIQRGQPACQWISAGQRSAELWEGPKTRANSSAKSPIRDTGNPVLPGHHQDGLRPNLLVQRPSIVAAHQPGDFVSAFLANDPSLLALSDRLLHEPQREQPLLHPRHPHEFVVGLGRRCPVEFPGIELLPPRSAPEDSLDSPSCGHGGGPAS